MFYSVVVICVSLSNMAPGRGFVLVTGKTSGTDPFLQINTPELYSALVEAVGERNRRIAKRNGRDKSVIDDEASEYYNIRNSRYSEER